MASRRMSSARSIAASSRRACASSPRACARLTPGRGRGLLRRASRAPVLQGPGDVHDLRSGRRAGARRRERRGEEPRHHGRHRSEEGRAGHDPRRPRRPASSRTSCTVPTASRMPRARSATSSPRRSSARAERLNSSGAHGPAPHGEVTNAKTNLLGLTRAGLEAFVVAMGEKPFRARQLMQVDLPARRGRLRRDDRSRQGLPQAASPEIAEIRVPEVITAQVVRGRHAQVAAPPRERPGHRDGLHPRARPRHALHLEPGRLRDGLHVLLDRRSRASTATSTRPRSSARSGSRTASSATRPTATA